jgi:hypothetical protein
MSAPTAEWEAWNWRDALSIEERRELLEVDDRHGWQSLVLNWGLVFASFALVALRRVSCGSRSPAWSRCS